MKPNFVAVILISFFIYSLNVNGEQEVPLRGITQVEILQTPLDHTIEARLAKIIDASGLVSHGKVISNEGIVTLNGKVAKQSQSEWLEKLVTETEGVIAVLNKLEVGQGEVLDLQPAKEEAGELVRKLVAFLPHILYLLLIVGFFVMVALLLIKIGRNTIGRKIQNPILTELIAKLFALPAVLLCLYFVLQISGLSNTAASVLGGTGALGLIIGFAMKNIMENYFSGLMLSLRKPYKVGDIVEIGGHMGVVQKLATRGTILVDFEGNHIIIPNTIIYGNTIINMTSNPSIRIKFTIDIPHWHDTAKVRTVIKKALAEMPEVLKDPDSRILVDEFTLASVKFKIYFWFDSNSSYAKIKSFAMENIKNRLNENDIQLAVETMQIHLVNEPHPTIVSPKRRKETHNKSDTQSERTDVLKVAEKGRSLDHGKELS